MRSLYDYSTAPDETLVSNIQNGVDVNASYLEISNRHSGAFLKMANKWVNRHQPIKFKLDAEHIFNSKDYVIYKSVMSFDPSRNTKLSTHITNNSMWFCSNEVKAGDKNSINSSIEDESFDSSRASYIDIDWEKAEMTELFNKIVEVVAKSLGRKGELIFRLRHGGHKTLKWKDVMLTLKEKYQIKASSQTCLTYQKKAMEAIKKEIANNPKFLEFSSEKL